jgi:signal peptidase II
MVETNDITVGIGQRARRGLLTFLIAAVIVGLDQLTKYLVMTYMELGQSIPEEGWIRLTYTTNTGGAFSLFANQGFLLAIASILGIAILVLYLRYLPLDSKVLKLGLALDLGGAVGNLIDRVRFGEVVDFVDIGAYPVFNVADSAITVGTVLIIYYLLFIATRKTRKPT